MNRLAFTSLCLMLLAALAPSFAQVAQAPARPGPDARFKADILLIVAHPDDETAVGSMLAKAIYDEGKHVAIVYCNRGNGGGNSHGIEQGTAMGLIREIEVRKAVSAFGITDVWFADGKDTPGQDVFQSLQNWRHGTVLEQVVRFIRLTRPEVILTWMPQYVAGENHGDHQASGVIATEAFDMSGDPTVFPAQVAEPRERLDINNVNEGLLPWQAKKIYYFSDADHPVKGEGPAFDVGAISRTKKVPYYRLAADLHVPHQTQGDVSDAAIEAIKTGNFTQFKDYLNRFQLIFGKSLVNAKSNGELFDGITPGAIPFAPPPGFHQIKTSGISLEFGGVYAFYRDFWRTHGIQHLAWLVKPELTIAAGAYMQFPLLLTNNSAESVEITLVPQMPSDWEVASGAARYRLAPGEVLPVQTILHAPNRQPQVCQVGWNAEVRGKSIGTCSMTVSLTEWTLPQ